MLAISANVKGVLWAAAVEPVILGFGSVLAALNLAKKPEMNMSMVRVIPEKPKTEGPEDYSYAQELEKLI